MGARYAAQEAAPWSVATYGGGRLKTDPCVRVTDSLRHSGDSQGTVKQLSSSENKAATALAEKPKLSLSNAWPPKKLLTLLSYRSTELVLKL